MVKAALVMHYRGLDYAEARRLLRAGGGSLRAAIEGKS
jgi:N-acetylmuramic acid 6-phosphate (MurNAc-6-P) etherase